MGDPPRTWGSGWASSGEGRVDKALRKSWGSSSSCLGSGGPGSHPWLTRPRQPGAAHACSTWPAFQGSVIHPSPAPQCWKQPSVQHARDVRVRVGAPRSPAGSRAGGQEPAPRQAPALCSRQQGPQEIWGPPGLGGACGHGDQGRRRTPSLSHAAAPPDSGSLHTRRQGWEAGRPPSSHNAGHEGPATTGCVASAGASLRLGGAPGLPVRGPVSGPAALARRAGV